MATSPPLDDPQAELLALTQALGAELQRRSRHGTRHTEAFEQPQTPARAPQSAPSPQPRQAAPAPASPGRPGSKRPAPAPAAQPAKPAAKVSAPPAVPKPVHRRRAPAATGTMDSLRRVLTQCMDCSLSAGPRGSGAIPGRGASSPRILFVTDFAGPTERQYGKVLSPQAGKMLSDMVTLGFKISLSEVYVTSAVKCPLAQGCRPSPKEAKSCSQHLIREIELLKPVTIIAFGPLAASALGFSDPAGIASFREKPLLYKGQAHQATLIITEHPRDMLADKSLKLAAWRDLQLLGPALGLPPFQ